MAFGALLSQNPGYTKEQTYSTATQALYPRGTDLPDQALSLLSKAIVESQDGTELKNLMGDVIASLPLSGAQIETGSYVGTGTAGVNNPNSLTFDFPPSYLVIAQIDSSSMITNLATFPVLGLIENNELKWSYFVWTASNYSSVNTASKKENNTVIWWSEGGSGGIGLPTQQFNVLDQQYMYYAWR